MRLNKFLIKSLNSWYNSHTQKAFQVKSKGNRLLIICLTKFKHRGKPKTRWRDELNYFNKDCSLYREKLKQSSEHCPAVRKYRLVSRSLFIYLLDVQQRIHNII